MPLDVIEHRAFLVQAFGYWGRGITLRKAAHACYKAGANRSDFVDVRLVIGDTTPQITNHGMNIETDHGATLIPIGAGFKLGSLMRLTSV